jgi:hypothetical protein
MITTSWKKFLLLQVEGQQPGFTESAKCSGHDLSHSGDGLHELVGTVCNFKNHLFWAVQRLHPYGLRCIALIFLTSICLFGKAAFGQQTGHYLQGITGLDNGSGLPPGVFVSYLPYIYKIDSLRGPNGNSLIQPDLTITAHNIAYQVTTKKKILGADYGLSVIIPIVNTRLTADLFNATQQQAGVSDIYFSPITLSWAEKKATYTVNYGFYAPVGQFDPTLVSNPGLGFWEHQIQAGAGYSFDKLKLWNASLLSTWEINQSKSGLDLKPGPMVTLEYSLGHRFDKYKINLGAAGYIYHKLSADSGSDISPLVAGALDRSFGIGPEFKYANPVKHFAFDFRYERQFAVQSKTQGDVFAIGISWLNFFPPSHP